MKDFSAIRQELGLKNAVPRRSDERDALLAGVVGRSLAEPNSKTYFNEREGRFVVVDPVLTVDDVRRWADFAGRS